MLRNTTANPTTQGFVRVATRRWCNPSPSRCRTRSEGVVSTCNFRRPRRDKQDARGRPLRKPAPPVIDDVVRELPPFTSAVNQPRLWRHWLPSLLRCAVAPQAARHPQGETKAPLGHPDPCHAPCRSAGWEPAWPCSHCRSVRRLPAWYNLSQTHRGAQAHFASGRWPRSNPADRYLQPWGPVPEGLRRPRLQDNSDSWQRPALHKMASWWGKASRPHPRRSQ